MNLPGSREGKRLTLAIHGECRTVPNQIPCFAETLKHRVDSVKLVAHWPLYQGSRIEEMVLTLNSTYFSWAGAGATSSHHGGLLAMVSPFAGDFDIVATPPPFFFF